MKTEIVLQLQKEPNGYGEVFAPNCEVKFEKSSGHIYLNYEHRKERIVGHYENLRQEGQNIVADVEIFNKLKDVEHRIGYAIEGAVISKNGKGEVELVSIEGVGALMPNKP